MKIDSIESVLALGIGLILVVCIILIAASVGLIIGHWKFYKKAGKNGWESIIPFYNDWVLVQIAGLDWWWFLLVIASTIMSVLVEIIPGLSSIEFITGLATILGNVGVAYNLSKKLHKGTGWIICATLFGPLVYAIAGYDNNTTYDSSVAVSKLAFFDKNKEANGTSEQPQANVEEPQDESADNQQ